METHRLETLDIRRIALVVTTWNRSLVRLTFHVESAVLHTQADVTKVERSFLVLPVALVEVLDRSLVVDEDLEDLVNVLDRSVEGGILGIAINVVHSIALSQDVPGSHIHIEWKSQELLVDVLPLPRRQTHADQEDESDTVDVVVGNDSLRVLESQIDRGVHSIVHMIARRQLQAQKEESEAYSELALLVVVLVVKVSEREVGIEDEIVRSLMAILERHEVVVNRSIQRQDIETMHVRVLDRVVLKRLVKAS